MNFDGVLASIIFERHCFQISPAVTGYKASFLSEKVTKLVISN